MPRAAAYGAFASGPSSATRNANPASASVQGSVHRFDANLEQGDAVDRFFYRLFTCTSPRLNACMQWTVRIARAPQGPPVVIGAMAGAVVALPLTIAAAVLLSRPDPASRDVGSDLIVSAAVIWAVICIAVLAIRLPIPTVEGERV
ncbi:hypothetical protein [Cupriavidus gilardii]|uniref:hypothetical protein n=1 Tax=Cupriavidus gilardii TaxID=82541 RepID=UPI001573A399|nr:hypothetical protein [Cupriavidus gilardii]